MRYFFRFIGQPIKIDPSTFVSRRSTIRVTGGGSITVGRGCEIHDFAMIMTYGGHITIGENCSLNPFAIIYGHGGVRIGNAVRIAAHSVIIPANHNVAVEGQPLHLSGVSTKGIDIEDNVWIGSGSRILDGVRIGENSIVAAGGIVTKTVPNNTTVAGVPARVIKENRSK
jgi:acetyltransferase-like isoleucine patch superfamily enzyme